MLVFGKQFSCIRDTFSHEANMLQRFFLFLFKRSKIKLLDDHVFTFTELSLSPKSSAIHCKSVQPLQVTQKFALRRLEFGGIFVKCFWDKRQPPSNTCSRCANPAGVSESSHEDRQLIVLNAHTVHKLSNTQTHRLNSE